MGVKVDGYVIGQSKIVKVWDGEVLDACNGMPGDAKQKRTDNCDDIKSNCANVREWFNQQVRRV
jgi:hypothetical protein